MTDQYFNLQKAKKLFNEAPSIIKHQHGVEIIQKDYTAVQKYIRLVQNLLSFLKIKKTSTKNKHHRYHHHQHHRHHHQHYDHQHHYHQHHHHHLSLPFRSNRPNHHHHPQLIFWRILSHLALKSASFSSIRF